ncbi:hypothetical protein VOLCADRAFT_79367 [Volvox carteri f. nagariensis]|uniref:Ubiquinol oxidase n=1 Tax=Volvox carteri f. nagariensis TaxID=3068 RepID=D8TK54_VOLCA|nr:uncharacterized protein VOLCADRAFT_79367 [Volvox carteri f. nagariensis]EFJ52002.1 hypothetical protein VOLCADRAFT_79367 [Volvox carteri f. nagariensis]|eukprot:XP_002946776.1 hypothetical protein VOLCADRAFT_79367 [Volvox carteri f. nagariensis]
MLPCPSLSRSGLHARRRTRGALRVHAVAAPIIPGKGECPLYRDRTGKLIPAMCADYGFRSGAGRLYQESYGEVPKDVWQLAKDNYRHELEQLRRAVRYPPSDVRQPSHPVAKALHTANGVVGAALASLDKALEEARVLPELQPPPVRSALETQEFKEIRARLDQLRLDADDVIAVERERIATGGGDMESPLWVKAPFYALCWLLDIMYDNKPIEKFWVLETVARIPYFAYISILHLYESLGFWRAGAELRKIHFAEEWNEMHHLQIMESLGGDRAWMDRFIAEHSAVFYYWVLILFYLVSPRMAYNFMQRVELHAADTYTAFLQRNAAVLESIPPPMVALQYYYSEDLYLFDEFQTASRGAPPRRPRCETLLDVFKNIRDDEMEHVKTMIACQNSTIAKDIAAASASSSSSPSPSATELPAPATPPKRAAASTVVEE